MNIPSLSIWLIITVLLMTSTAFAKKQRTQEGGGDAYTSCAINADPKDDPDCFGYKHHTQNLTSTPHKNVWTTLGDDK